MAKVPPKVFLDTNALKYAAARLIRASRYPKIFKWGDTEATIPVTRWYEDYPNEKLPWRQRLETVVLPFFAWLAANDRLHLLGNTEVNIEFWRLPKTDDPRGLFYGAPIDWVETPITYNRIIAGGFQTAREHQLTFLAGLRHERFLQLQKATGAYQGAQKKNANQLLDAFHIWCAEGASADFFLTLDHKLLRHLAQHRRYPPKMECVSPRQLVMALQKRGAVFWSDFFRYLPHYARHVR